MESNELVALSDAMARAVAVAGAATVRVDARKGLSGSGVVIQPGWVLTANHVVERETGVRVELPDGSEVAAQLAGRDAATDLCLLRLENEGASACQSAPAEAQVGQFVLALGRPTSEGIQASLGVVGAVGGPLPLASGGFLDRFIRTDAIPYPGFSGGPLVDGHGWVVGINTSGFAPGASLAIPAAEAWQVAEALRSQGRIRRGYLGIHTQAVELPAGADEQLGRAQRTGLLLAGIERGKAGDQAGWLVGDILVGLESNRIERHDDLVRRLAGNAAGKTMQVELLRGGRLVRSSVRIGER